jgi:hypothetical protein
MKTEVRKNRRQVEGKKSYDRNDKGRKAATEMTDSLPRHEQEHILLQGFHVFYVILLA